MVREHLREHEAAEAVMHSIEMSLADPQTRTRDLGGTADTITAGRAIASHIV